MHYGYGESLVTGRKSQSTENVRSASAPGLARYGSRLPFLQWEERKEAASVCTGVSSCPPDSCIWMGSTPFFLFRQEKATPWGGLFFACYCNRVSSVTGQKSGKKNRPGAQRLQALPGGAGYGSRLPFLQWEERKEAASVCTGVSSCPLDSCIWMGSTPSFLQTRKSHPVGWPFLVWSRIRESNPPSRLGKPLYYRYTNPACAGIIAEPAEKSNHFLSKKVSGNRCRPLKIIREKTGKFRKKYLTIGTYSDKMN